MEVAVTNKKMLVLFIQDRSGSMNDNWAETLQGFKTYVDELKKGAKEDGVDYDLSLTTFDTLMDSPLVKKPIEEIDANILAAYGPRGGTALWDAVGSTIQGLDVTSYEKILCVIVTDGYENSSREWDKLKINKLIDEKLKAGNWTFTYMGTQPETWSDSATMGTGMAAATNYNPAMARQSYIATAGATRAFGASSMRTSSNIHKDFMTPESRLMAGLKTDDDLTDAEKLAMLGGAATTTITTVFPTNPVAAPISKPAAPEKRDEHEHLPKRWR